MVSLSRNCIPSLPFITIALSPFYFSLLPYYGNKTHGSLPTPVANYGFITSSHLDIN